MIVLCSVTGASPQKSEREGSRLRLRCMREPVGSEKAGTIGLMVKYDEARGCQREYLANLGGARLIQAPSVATPLVQQFHVLPNVERSAEIQTLQNNRSIKT